MLRNFVESEVTTINIKEVSQKLDWPRRVIYRLLFFIFVMAVWLSLARQESTRSIHGVLDGQV